MRLLKNIIKSVDPYLGKGPVFRIPWYSSDGNITGSGAGPLTASEWSHVKKPPNQLLYDGADGSEYDSNKNHI